MAGTRYTAKERANIARIWAIHHKHSPECARDESGKCTEIPPTLK